MSVQIKGKYALYQTARWMQAGGCTLKHWPVSLPYTHSVCVGGGGRPCILTSKCVTAGVFLGKETEAVEQQTWSKDIFAPEENTGCIPKRFLHLPLATEYYNGRWFPKQSARSSRYSWMITNANTNKKLWKKMMAQSLDFRFIYTPSKVANLAVIIEFLAKMFCS